jgi:hypothetical protein
LVILNRLSARAVATLTKPGRHADGGELYLKSGAKHWTFMWVRGVRQRKWPPAISIEEISITLPSATTPITQYPP